MARQAIALTDACESYNRGYAQQLKGDWDGALTNYEKAIKCRPDYAEGYAGRAAVERKKGDLNGAKDDYDQALALKPKLGEALASEFEMLGCLYYERQQFTNALSSFQKACELVPALRDHNSRNEIRLRPYG